MIYNTEIFRVSDVGEFKRALEGLRGALTEAGGTEIRLFRCVDDPTKVLAAMCWPDAESCRAFARDHEAEVDAALRASLTSHEPEELWEEI
jgi:heme-degrading monooxygenase HmoA